MISRNEDKGFFAAHWDWLVAGLGVLALVAAGAGFMAACGTDPEQAANDEALSLGRGGSRGAIEAVDMTGYAAAMKVLESPSTVVEPAETQGSFLASDRRVFCEQGGSAAETKACGLPIPFGLKVCPFCGAKQPEEVKVALDSDGDGIPDETEKKWGMNPNDAADADADKDGDGFTNLEEFEAGTDPTDPASHPDYLDFLKIVPPLKETPLPFFFAKVKKLPAGDKFVFENPRKKTAFGGNETYDAALGEKIGTSGFTVKSYVKSSRKIRIKGSVNSREEDTSTVTIQRASDRKEIGLVVGVRKLAALDMKAKLVFERTGLAQEVVRGDTLTLHKTAYKVVDVAREGKIVKVTLEDASAKRRTLQALEQ